jgi:hypothetical protein
LISLGKSRATDPVRIDETIDIGESIKNACA